MSGAYQGRSCPYVALGHVTMRAGIGHRVRRPPKTPTAVVPRVEHTESLDKAKLFGVAVTIKPFIRTLAGFIKSCSKSKVAGALRQLVTGEDERYNTLHLAKADLRRICRPAAVFDEVVAGDLAVRLLLIQEDGVIGDGNHRVDIGVEQALKRSVLQPDAWVAGCNREHAMAGCLHDAAPETAEGAPPDEADQRSVGPELNGPCRFLNWRCCLH
jgi:hypothetical protein